MNASITNEKANLSQLERKSRELQMKLDMLSMIEQDTVKSMQLVENNASLLKEKHVLAKALEEGLEEAKKHQASLAELSIREEQLQRQMNTACEKLARLESLQIEKRSGFQSQLLSLREEYGRLVSERAALSLKVEGSDKMVKEIEQKVPRLFCFRLTT